MGNGWYFAMGWIACTLWLSWAIPPPFPFLRSVTRHTWRAIRKPRWRIGGVVYRPVRLTRATMERIAQLQVATVPELHPMLQMIHGQEVDPDEFRARHLRDSAAGIQQAYDLCNALLEDADGEHPSVELLSDELTIDQCTRIVQRILG